VTGEVQTIRSRESPRLAEARPQGTDPGKLLLDLTIRFPGVGEEGVDWKEVRFEKVISAKQYLAVFIRHDGGAETVLVEEVLS
jgi:hypothetical protein